MIPTWVAWLAAWIASSVAFVAGCAWHAAVHPTGEEAEAQPEPPTPMCPPVPDFARPMSCALNAPAYTPQSAESIRREGRAFGSYGAMLATIAVVARREDRP